LHATYVPPPFHSERLVMTVHGLVNFLHPEFFDRDRLRRLNPLMRKGIKQAECLLFVSEHAMRQTQEMFHVPDERSMVVYHGVGAHFRPLPRDEARTWVRERFGVEGPYLLYCGKIQPGKNVELLVSAYHEFARRTGCTLPLLMVGRNVSGILDGRTDARADGEGTIIWAGHVPSEELPGVYSGAEMLLFPSLFESFGLPVVESMACGTPVICSNAGALPEIAGGAALMVDPHSMEDLVGAMIRLSQSSELRETLIERGLARARQFSWDQCARDTLNAYSYAAR
jgi:alpha-1,3-rhamnosyl/mannosyltransferase